MLALADITVPGALAWVFLGVVALIAVGLAMLALFGERGNADVSASVRIGLHRVRRQFDLAAFRFETRVETAALRRDLRQAALRRARSQNRGDR